MRSSFLSRENEIKKTTMEQDVKYKTKESNGLDKSNAELISDRETLRPDCAFSMRTTPILTKRIAPVTVQAQKSLVCLKCARLTSRRTTP